MGEPSKSREDMNMTKEELKTIEQKVLWELENNPSTRGSDKMLTMAVYMDFYNMTGTTPYVDVMLSKVPSYESIGRARRKIQETREDLRGEDRIERERLKNQEAYIDYALDM
jgi:hypothetical protein